MLVKMEIDLAKGFAPWKEMFVNNEHRLKYPRTFEKGHTINWTYLIDNEWKKKIKTSAI